MDLKTVTVLVTLGCVVPVCEGEHHVTCTTEPIQSEEGDDVTLKCYLDPPVDLLDHNLVVSRPNFRDEVHVYQDRKDLTDPQMTWYRGRTTLLHDDLQRGLVTLKISSVQLSDSGQYRLFIRDLNAHGVIDLHVAEKGRHHRTTTEAPRTTKTPDAGPQRQHVAAIVGAVVGGVVLLGIVGLIVGVLVKLGKIKLSGLSLSNVARSCCGPLYKHGYQPPGQQVRELGADRDREQELQPEV